MSIRRFMITHTFPIRHELGIRAGHGSTLTEFSSKDDVNFTGSGGPHVSCWYGSSILP